MAYKSAYFKYTDTLTNGIKKYRKKINMNSAGGADEKAKMKVALQILNNVINGSRKESVVPPIQTGTLRGSGSAFIGSRKIGDTKGDYPEGTPAETYGGKKGEVIIGFNTAYAAKLHEKNWTPGGVRPSKQAARNPGMLEDVGNKFVEKHLRADKDDLLKFYAAMIKKETKG